MFNLNTLSVTKSVTKAEIPTGRNYSGARKTNHNAARRFIAFRRFCVVGLLGTGLTAGTLFADAEFIYEGSGFQKDARIVVRGGKVMLTHNDESSMSLIYDTVAQLFQVLNHREKTYLELTEEFLQTAIVGVESLLPQLKAMAQSGNINERQRELLERITAGASQQSENGAITEAQVADTGKKKSVLGLTCSVHSVRIAGESLEVCTIDYSTVGLKPEDQESLRELSGTLGNLSSGLQFHEAQRLAAVIGSLDGIVLEALDSSGDETLKLKQLTLATRSSSDGEVPTDYSETDLFSIFTGL